ncbi:MAG: COX15/CtaA family protein, partial [Candidatus Hodarchaeota archaeon]
MSSENPEAGYSFFQIQNYRLASYALVIATYILVLLGGWVTAIDARDECSDWPLCDGKIVPTDASSEIWAIYIHQLWTVFV